MDSAYRTPPPMQPAAEKSVYERHREAAGEYHEACHAYQDASNRRDVAAKNLAAITEELHKLAAFAQHDPTVPREAGNALNEQIGRQSRY